MSLSVESLFDLEELNISRIFEKVKYPWEALPKIESTIIEFSKSLPEYFIRLDKNVLIKEPAIIGYDC